MASFHFNPNKNLIIVNNIAHRSEPFSVEENDGHLIVNILSENTDDESYVPAIFAVISIKNKVISLYGNIKLIKWSNDNFEVLFNLEPITYYASPTAIAQESYSGRGLEHIVTLYRDRSMQLLLECNGKVANFKISHNIRNAKILLQPTSLGFLSILTADADFDKEYLCLVLYDGKYEKLFEDVADKISFTQNSFIVTSQLSDMLSRKSEISYTFIDGCFKITNKRFTYGHEKNYPQELIPYLFLEALQAGDDVSAKGYLSDDLSDMLSHFKTFFGNFTKIECPQYQTLRKNDLTKVALLYSCDKPINQPKFFSFMMEDSKITNVSD
ncbi:MAG: hypothetical protein RR357_03700 [Clostridia bacterium]